MDWGFSVCADASSVEFCLFGSEESDARSLTTFARRPGGCAVLTGRLHYREQVSAALRARARPVSDAALALAAFETWGIDGIRRLEGDYCVVIWDASSKTLVAARDPMGGFPIYWTRSNEAFMAATTMAPLLSADGGRLDPDFIADYLSQPLMATQDELTEATIFRGIRRVMPGRLLTARLPDLEVGIRATWNWEDHVVDPGTERAEEIAEQFLPLVRDAVRERISGTTAAHLSGGMDSTAIALTADQLIDRGVGKRPLHALSLVYERSASLAGETAYLDLVLARHPQIVSHRIAADGLLPYDALAEETIPDEPYAIIFCRAQDQAVADVAAANGVDTILSGCGGDDVFDIAPYHMSELVRAGRIGEAWRKAAAWGEAYGCDAWTMLRRFGLGPLVPASLHGGLRALLHRAPVTVAPWLSPDFARTYCVEGRGLSRLDQLYRGCRPAGLAVSLASVRGLAADRRRWALAARGIMLCHPFMDPRILSLALGLRLRYRPDANEQKPLLAHAMRDVLPSEIRARRGKVNYSELYYRGLTRNLPVLESQIRATRIDEFDLIDRDALIDCLRQTALGCEASPARGTQLNLTLSLLTWLSIRERARSSPRRTGRTFRLPVIEGAAGALAAAPC